MPETPNHGYNVPNEGEQDWHEPLNENFEAYDTDIEIRDEQSNRGNYEPKAGAKFLATDTGAVYVGDGSNWELVATTGPVPTFDQAVLDSRSPLLRLHSDGDELAELSGETSGDAGRLLLSLYGADGRRWTALSANRQNHVGIGGIGSVPLDVRGQNRWNLDDTDGDVRIGDSDHRLTMGVALGGGGAGTSRIRAKGGTERLRLGGGDSDTVEITGSEVSVDGDLTISNDGSMNVWWDAGTDDYIRTYVDMQEKEFNWTFNSASMGFTSDGDFYVSGAKNFTQTVDTDDGQKEVVYTATEAGTPHTEATGVAELKDGRAEVDLPEHFAWVTDDEEPLAVQTTPYGGSAGLKVVERSTDRIVVEDLDGEGDYEFAYTVKGTRDGYADQEVVREPSVGEREESEQAPRAPADD